MTADVSSGLVGKVWREGSLFQKMKKKKEENERSGKKKREGKGGERRGWNQYLI